MTHEQQLRMHARDVGLDPDDVMRNWTFVDFAVHWGAVRAAREGDRMAKRTSERMAVAGWGRR